MDQPAQSIADRYHLWLAPHWRNWFEQPNTAVAQPEFSLPGAFQSRASTSELLSAKPSMVWAGFMLPDTLPVIGNEYGDWICVRVAEDNALGELIHWYHGGGDWIPVGHTLAEALLHDLVDQFRPLRQQMLRGAAEMLLPDHLSNVRGRFAAPELRDWLVTNLQISGVPTVHDTLNELFEHLFGGEYRQALTLLLRNNWAFEATACDLVESLLHQPLARLHHALRNIEADSPERTKVIRWLFDPENQATPIHLAELVSEQELASARQEWRQAEQLCVQTISRRADLAWAFDILGWCQQRSNRREAALDTYFAGRFASSFTDQAVRLGSHWFDQRFGKFCVAQLAEHAQALPPEYQRDDYLRVILDAPPRGLLGNVQQFWMNMGREQLSAGNGATAYQSFYRAGWDLGASRLTDYRSILEMLIEAARIARWPAREAVARMHLDSLSF
ncbi:MAG: hypothetical protein R3C53_02890 [Pirellulaceae bacterium]